MSPVLYRYLVLHAACAAAIVAVTLAEGDFRTVLKRRAPDGSDFQTWVFTYVSLGTIFAPLFILVHAWRFAYAETRSYLDAWLFLLIVAGIGTGVCLA